MIHAEIRRDPATLVICALLDLCAGDAALEWHRGTAWASATFTGMRHALRLSFAGAAAVRRGEWLAAMVASHEFELPGHIVADMMVTERQLQGAGEPALSLTLEALTVEDD